MEEARSICQPRIAKTLDFTVTSQETREKEGRIMELNPSQKKALDQKRDIIVSASAGSGKTRVLVERVLSLFLHNASLSMENVAAITFTDKAAAELKERITARLFECLKDAPDGSTRDRVNRLLENLTGAYIGTIHGFCRRILAEFPLQARVDAGFSILEQADAGALSREAVREILSGAATNPASPLREDLRILLRYVGANKLNSILNQMLDRRDLLEGIIRHYESEPEQDFLNSLRKTMEQKFPETPFREGLERIHLSCLRSLTRLFRESSKGYEARKGFGSSLDFDDILIRGVELVEQNEEVRNILRRRFRHILVDEFQDTDAFQWKIFTLLTEGREAGSLFLVGDPKQSIYGFRRADVRLFYMAGDQLEKANRERKTEAVPLPGEMPDPTKASRERLGRLTLKENYRSLPSIVDFVNYFFSRLMPPESRGYEVAYESLVAQKGEQAGGVEIMIADPEQISERNGPSPSGIDRQELEAEFIAGRIGQLIAPEGDLTFLPGQIAILIRSRGYLKTYEAALERNKIPYLTVSGVGFYERQEIFDLANFLKFLVSPEDDPALLGLLRSPFFRLSEELIFKVSQTGRESLWDRLKKSLSSDAFPEEDRKTIARVIELLSHFRFESQRKPLSILMKDFLIRTGGWVSLSAGRQRENVEKLLERARRFDASGFRSLFDFTEELLILIDQAEREGEAPLPLSQVDSVLIMTIHKAKGLEFPVVFLPGITSNIFSNRGHAFLFDEELGMALRVADPEASFEPCEPALYTALKEREREKQLAEDKRLFYVGVTRAENLLVLSGAMMSREPAHSRFQWLKQVFPLEEAMSKGAPLTYEVQGRKREIPVRTSLPPRMPGELGSPPETSSEGIVWESSSRYLEPLPGSSVWKTFSVARLNEFHLCPIRYYYTHTLGWSEEILDKLTGGQPPMGKYLVRGTILHRFLQDYVSGKEFDAKFLAESLLKGETELPEEEKTDLNDDILQTWSDLAERKSLHKLRTTEEKKTELPFRLNFETTIVHGRVDLCFFENGIWMVLDYKAGRPRPGEVKARAGKYEIQMDAYALFLSLFAPNQASWPVLLFFFESDLVHKKEYNRDEIDRSRERIGKLLDRARAFQERYSSPESRYDAPTIESMLNRFCPDCPRNKGEGCPFHLSIKALLPT